MKQNRDSEIKRILIIDDEPNILRLITHILKSENYDIETAQNGKVAIELYRKKPFDLFITDIIMPEMDGIELILKLRNYNKKIIAISGHDEDMLETASMLGADFIFQKPINVHKFRKAVKLLLA